MEDLVKKLKSLNLLYVEDDLDVLALEQKSFEFFFNKVYIATDGEEALQVYSEEKVDLIILDIHMPKKDGIEVAKEIRKKDTTTPIIMLTAYSDTKYLMEAVKLKLEDYLIKPVNFKELIALFEKIFTPKSRALSSIHLAGGSLFHKENRFITTKHKKEVQLGVKEEKLLLLLLKDPNKTYTKTEINQEVWENNMSEDSYRNLLRNLRNKIGEESIETVTGIGLKVKLAK